MESAPASIESTTTTNTIATTTTTNTTSTTITATPLIFLTPLFDSESKLPNTKVTSQISVDIIKFYNTVFLDALETFLCELDSNPQLLSLRTASPFKNLRPHRSPHKIGHLTISPRKTPLLLRERNTKSVILGTPGASPRKEFSIINQCLNSPLTPGGDPTRTPKNPRLVKRHLTFEDTTATDQNSTNGNIFSLHSNSHQENNTPPHPVNPIANSENEQHVKKGVKRPREQLLTEPNKKAK